jgi:hypothetical protein
MKKTLAMFFLLPSLLLAQTPSGYVLVKNMLTPPGILGGAVTWQWVASNHTGSPENFYILDQVSSGSVFQSIVGSDSGLNVSPVLPVHGAGAVTVGPFALSADGAATFTAVEDHPADAGADSFFLLTQNQLARVQADSVTLQNPTQTPSSGPLVQAMPNFSTGGEPIHFSVLLTSAADIQLSIYANSLRRRCLSHYLSWERAPQDCCG